MNSRQIIATSASIVLLLFAGVFWYANQNFNNAQLTLNYYQAPNLEELKGMEASELAGVVKDAFSRKNYARAIEIGQNIPPDMPGYWDARILLAHSFMKENKTREAIEVFSEIIDSENAIMKENAKWHRVLANVQAGNEAQTIHYLNEMTVENTSNNASLAKKLKSDLEGFWRKLVLK